MLSPTAACATSHRLRAPTCSACWLPPSHAVQRSIGLLALQAHLGCLAVRHLGQDRHHPLRLGLRLGQRGRASRPRLQGPVGRFDPHWQAACQCLLGRAARAPSCPAASWRWRRPPAPRCRPPSTDTPRPAGWVASGGPSSALQGVPVHGTEASSAQALSCLPLAAELLERKPARAYHKVTQAQA